MKQLLRWVLLIIGAMALGLALVLAFLAIKDAQISKQSYLYIFFSIWIAIWLGTGFYLKKQGKVKQPFAHGFMAGMLIAAVGLSTIDRLIPTKEELIEKAQKAEQEYFILSAGSLDHSRICNAAKSTYNYYRKAEIEDKTKLFEYIIISDKCL